MLAREIHRLGDVRGPGATGDKRGLAVERPVPDEARAVVALLAREQQVTTKPFTEVFDVCRSQQQLPAVEADRRYIAAGGSEEARVR
jgi:hypothetical protein